jgi:predicted Zn-dependent protease
MFNFDGIKILFGYAAKSSLMFRKIFPAILAVSLVFSAGCKKDEGVNIFTIEDDKQLGLKAKEQIAADPAQFPVLDPVQYADAYAYLNAIRNDILNSGKVSYKDAFPWEVHIIHQDDIQNAFCTPGGYIYVYTGLIKYLDDKSSLAGVLGHEIAHADKRHSTTQMTKQYGLQTLLDVVLGNNQGLLTQITAELINLKFSRSDETEADKYSVTYLCPTKYHADGAASFFQKIIDQGSATPPEFLSTHPSPDNRVENIRSQASSQGCSTTITQSEDVDGYAAFKAMLP